MRFWIGLDNFAKIERAKVCVSNYTVLVGQNNSGKTFLMQLVQGVSSKLSSLFREDVFSVLTGEEHKDHIKYTISRENIDRIIEYLNGRLDEEKEVIVRDIFKKNIAIERLYIDISFEENVSYEICCLKNGTGIRGFLDESFASKKDRFIELFEKWPEESERCILSKINLENGRKKTQFIHAGFSDGKSENRSALYTLKSLFEEKSLFLPASRTGLLLLYREFFANQTDDRFFKIQDDRVVEVEENSIGLTEPVYEFLRFLQTYTENDELRTKYENDLDFFEKKLIEGHISVNKQGVFSYNAVGAQEGVPMYLASSMINEIAPIVLAVTSDRQYRKLIIDEIESSLHPEKQLELVRFLNRLSNDGIKLMISTHSETFALRLNNLFILSKYIEKTQDEEKLSIFGLEKEDLIDTDKLFVYEFTIQPNGKSIVKEIQANDDTGYLFELFVNSTMKLYSEALGVGEIQ